MVEIHTLDERFAPVVEVFTQNINTQELGAGFAAYIGDTCIINMTGGYADRQKTLPYGANTLVPVYSTTKGVAALILGLAVENLPEQYNTPVVDVWPEFAAHGKDKTTIAQIASHQAGLSGFIDAFDPALWLDPPALAALLAQTKPLWPLGDGHGYHPLTWGYLVQELVTRITGRSVGQIIAEKIPSVDFAIGLPAAEHSRVADMLRPRRAPDLGTLTDAKRAAFMTKWAAPNRAGAEWREIEIPSANGHGTAKSVAQIYGAWANGGKVSGVDVKLPMYDGMTKTYTSGPDKVLNTDTTFAAGIMRNTQRIYGPNPNSFGHSGWGGSLALGDPDSGLSCGYVMNMQSHHLQGDPRATKLVAAVYACM